MPRFLLEHLESRTRTQQRSRDSVAHNSRVRLANFFRDQLLSLIRDIPAQEHPVRATFSLIVYRIPPLSLSLSLNTTTLSHLAVYAVTRLPDPIPRASHSLV